MKQTDEIITLCGNLEKLKSRVIQWGIPILSL
jgi:hypothetical protein